MMIISKQPARQAGNDDRGANDADNDEVSMFIINRTYYIITVIMIAFAAVI